MRLVLQSMGRGAHHHSQQSCIASSNGTEHASMSWRSHDNSPKLSSFQLAQARGLHLMCAPFVQLAPTFRALWGRIQDGVIGTVHSARALYGNAGSTWAEWYHDGSVGPLAEVGIYNLKTLTAALGPVVEVQSAESLVVEKREISGQAVRTAGSDVSHALLRHQDGALSSLVSSHCIQRYRRPALEFYGTEGTANLLGDDWDPRGFDLAKQCGCWENLSRSTQRGCGLTVCGDGACAARATPTAALSRP
jgi:hypothetical protein